MSSNFHGQHTQPFGRGRGAFAGSSSARQQQQQPRQEDSQPNLSEGWNLRPPTYKIGRKEPEPAPPNVTSSHVAVPPASQAARTNNAKQQDIDWSKVPTGPSGMQGSKNMSWKRDTSTQVGGQQSASNVMTNPADGQTVQSGRRFAPASKPSAITLPTPDQLDNLRAQKFASRSPASTADVSARSSSNGAIRVSEAGDVWRSPTGRAESSTPGLSSAAMLLASVSRVDSSTSDTEWSNSTRNRAQRETPVATTSRSGSISGHSLREQRTQAAQDRIDTPIASTSGRRTLTGDTADSSTPRAQPLFRTPSLEEVKREAPSSRSALKGKGKEEADPQQWEVISITDDSDMEADELPGIAQSRSRPDPQDMEIDQVNVTSNQRPLQNKSAQRSNTTADKRDHRTHIFHFSQALIDFTKEYPDFSSNLESYEIRREQERLSAAGFESKVEDSKGPKQVQMTSWRKKEGMPLPSIGEKSASDGLYHYTHLSGAPARYYSQYTGGSGYRSASGVAKRLSSGGATVHYAVVNPPYTVFEVIYTSTVAATPQKASIESQRLREPQTSSVVKPPDKAKLDLTRHYIYHFSLALAQHDCGKSNYVHLLKEYELDFEKDRASSQGYRLELGSIGDTVEITAKPKSDSTVKPFDLDSHDKENNIWHHYYPRKADARYIRKEYATRAEREERLSRSSPFLEGLRKDWYEVETAVLGPSYTVVEVARPRKTVQVHNQQEATSRLSNTGTSLQNYLLRPSVGLKTFMAQKISPPAEANEIVWNYEQTEELKRQRDAGFKCKVVRNRSLEVEIQRSSSTGTWENAPSIGELRGDDILPSTTLILPRKAKYFCKTWRKPITDQEVQETRTQDQAERLQQRGHDALHLGTESTCAVFLLKSTSTGQQRKPPTPEPVHPNALVPSNGSTLQAISQSLTSVFDLPIRLHCTSDKAPTARQKADRINFVHEKYEELELNLGKPVTPAHEGEIFSDRTVRLIYDAPALLRDRFLVPLPQDCLYSHSSAPLVKQKRDDFKFQQGIMQAQQGKVAKEAFFSHAFLVMVLNSSNPTEAIPQPKTAAMEIDERPRASSNRVPAAAPIIVKRETHSPTTPLHRPTRPATPVSPSAPSRPVCFPFNIKTSYSDSAHTKTNVESFLKIFIEHYEASRTRLIDFYTQSATFGYTVNDGSGVRRKEDTISAFGNYSIINTLRRLPACTHQTGNGKLIYDAMRIGASKQGLMAYSDILVTLHGEFIEFESGNKRSFDRTFYLSPVDNPARLPYLIMSDSIMVRAWSSSAAWKPSSLPQQSAETANHFKAPAKPATPQKIIALPKPKLTSAAFVRAVSEMPQNMADYDAREEQRPIASASSSASRSAPVLPAKVTGKRPQRVVEIDDSDDEFDMLGAGAGAERGLSSEGRRVKARTDGQAGTPDPVAVSKLEERVKTLELRLNASVSGSKGSSADTMLSKKQKKKANKAARLEEAPAPRKKAGPLSARESFIALSTNHTDHTMWGSRSRSKARMFFHAPETSGYLGVSMGGDVELWRPDRLVRTSQQLATMPSDLHKDLTVDAAIFSETHQAVIVGYRLGIANAAGTSEPLPQACILRLNKYGRSGEPSGPLQRDVLEHRPHVKNQIAAMTLLTSANPQKEKFATAGNDGIICIWDIPESGARSASPRQIRTNHSSAIRALVQLAGQSKRLLSAGMDSRVNIVDIGKNTEIQTWKESTAIQRAYAHPANHNLAMLCLASIEDQFRLVDLRHAPNTRQPLVFGARTQKEAALGQYYHGQFNGDLFAYAFDDAVRIWDIRNTSKPFIVKTGISDIIQPYFESSTRMTFLEKHHFSTLSYQYAADS